MIYEVRNQGGVFTVLADGEVVADRLTEGELRKLESETPDPALARLCRVSLGVEKPRMTALKEADPEGRPEPEAEPEPEPEASPEPEPEASPEPEPEAPGKKKKGK